MATSNPHNQTLQLPFHSNPPNFHPQNPRNMNMNKNNPFGFPPFKNQELCNQFKMGNCRYGGNCKYRHEQRLGFYEPRRTGMFGMENGVVRNCKWALEMCPFGKKCVFEHKVELGCKRVCERGFDGVVAKRSCRMSGQELDQMDGFKVREGIWKTKLCHKWEIFGSCTYGGACHFAHGREELKQTDSLSSLGWWPNRTPGRTGSSSCYGQKRQRKKSLFKWNDVAKISRIYADWIDLAPVC